MNAGASGGEVAERGRVVGERRLDEVRMGIGAVEEVSRSDVHRDMIRGPRLGERRRREEARDVAVDEALTELAGEHRYRGFQVFEQERPEERGSDHLVEVLVRDDR